MSLAVRPVFDKRVPRNVRPPLGEILVAEMDALESLASSRRIPSLSAFSDPREVPAGFRGSPDELNDLLGPCDIWFDAATGALALKRLAQVARSCSDVESDIEDKEDVAEELETLAAALEAAGRVGARFRLDLVG
jgi:hypothetical protein